MTTRTTIALGAAAVIGGIGVVIAADRLGWLRASPAADTRVAATDWCAEHGVPESQCTICNPSLLVDAQGQQNDAEDGHDRDINVVRNEQQLPRAQRAPSVTCATAQAVVQLANADVARRAGLTVERVTKQPVTHMVECNAELAFDGNRLVHLSPRGAGSVTRVMVQVGNRVNTGDQLAVVDSIDLGNARAVYLQNLALSRLRQQEYDRNVALSEGGVTPRRELQDAQTRLAEVTIALSAAQQHLRALGLSDEQIQQTAETNDTSSSLSIVAPFAGVVVERHAVQGEMVGPEHVMFTIADTSRMWAMLDVFETDARLVKVGQNVMLNVQALPGETFAGALTWISPTVDPRTRTIKARAELDNADEQLRANMFGRARIVVRDREDALVVPKSAVQWEGCCNVVFVKQTDTVYQPYRVRLGEELDEAYVVEEGLDENEQIVTQGSFLLKTEILKGSIGAGCCEVHGASES